MYSFCYCHSTTQSQKNQGTNQKDTKNEKIFHRLFTSASISPVLFFLFPVQRCGQRSGKTGNGAYIPAIVPLRAMQPAAPPAHFL